MVRAVPLRDTVTPSPESAARATVMLLPSAPAAVAAMVVSSAPVPTVPRSRLAAMAAVALR